VHNFSSHTFKAALTNTAPTVATDTGLANITEIAATGGYSAGGYALDGVTWTQSSNVTKLTITDEVITAAGGNVGPFRYIVVYNDSATSPADALIGYLDYGSALTLADTETLTLDFSAADGLMTITV
jgi:hypothetical protein